MRPIWSSSLRYMSTRQFRCTPGRGAGSMFGVVVAMVLGLSAGAAHASEPVSFRYDVLPVLTKAGCNAGTCHGTPTGKNGFRLSLRGYDPELDLHTLTREVQARRINRFHPADSLVLLKATAELPHEGGRRFDSDSKSYRLLHDWIAQGAVDDVESVPKLERLEITPSDRTLHAPTDSQAMRVTAHFADGSHRDVTDLARFTVHDESIARVSPEGVVTKEKRGEAIVSAEYCNQFASARLIFLEPAPEFAWPDPPANNVIDEHVFAKLKLLKIEPSALSTDAEFVRRVHLDTIGRLPTPDEVRHFLNDEQSDKRARLIDELLDRPEFADWWAMKWADRLGCNQRFVGKAGAVKYHEWIRHAMAANMPEDEFVYTLLTAAGPNYSIPPASFWRRLRVGGIASTVDPLMAAEEISQLFMGIRIQCARCHNHPAERWTQDDYYGLAAFFPRLKFKDGPFVNHRYDKEDTVYIVPNGEVKHARTGETAVPTPLDEAPLEIPAGIDRRAVFAEWLTAPENPYFARTSVNRLWFHVFGRGIVEPVDDFRTSNPPSHPEVLEALTEEFVRSGFDRKHILRIILNSRVYQLSSRTTPTNAEDERYFSHATIRLLPAESLLDAISQATEVPEKFPGLPVGTAAIELPDGEYKHPFLQAFGRPARASACECERDSGTNLSQALHLVSGEIVHRKIRSDKGRAARLAASSLTNEEVLDELFLATLCRYPKAEERELLIERLAASGTDRRQAVEDVLWLLVNHTEFLFQH